MIKTQRTYRSLAIDFKLGLEPRPGELATYQTIVGCRRVPSTIKVSWVEEADK